MTGDTSTQPTSGGRRADIQGLRAVAVLLVVAYHAGLPVDGGFTGVDVFFVISGYVITGLLLREVDATDHISFAAFYARRVRRILPALALTTVVVAITSIGAISQFTRAITARTGIAASLLVSNVYLYRSPNGYFDIDPSRNPLLHMWSLSVEEQFYLVFPAVLVGALLLARRRNRDRRTIMGLTVGLVAIASFVLSIVATNAGPDANGLNSRFAFYMAPTRAWEFAVGALLGLVAARLARLPRSAGLGAGVVGAGLVAAGALLIDSSTAFPGTAALLPVAGAALLLVAGARTSEPPIGVSAVLSVRPMIAIGDRSYSWYLWHWPVIVFAAALWPDTDHVKVVAAAVSLLPAFASYRWLERPIHTNIKWKGRRAVALATVCIVIPIIACIGLLRAPKPSGGIATQSLQRASKTLHADHFRGCDRGRGIARAPERCTWSVPRAQGRIVLLGDSNAGHFTEPVTRAANRLGYDATVATSPNCPFLDLEPHGAQTRPAACTAFNHRLLRELAADPPALAVIAASTPTYLANQTTFHEPSGAVAVSEADKAAAWRRALRRTLTTLDRAGVRTLVVQTVPQWLSWDPVGCAAIRVQRDPASCGTTQTRAEVAAFRQAAVRAERQAAAAVASASTVDFVDAICTRTTCATNRGNLWLYRDGRHLSVPGSLTLTNDFEAAMRAALDSAAR